MGDRDSADLRADDSAELQNELAAAYDKIIELTQKLVDAEVRAKQARQAAASAAETTMLAIEKVQEMDPVVKAAKAWLTSIDNDTMEQQVRHRAHLLDKTNEFIEKESKRS